MYCTCVRELYLQGGGLQWDGLPLDGGIGEGSMASILTCRDRGLFTVHWDGHIRRWNNKEGGIRSDE